MRDGNGMLHLKSERKWANSELRKTGWLDVFIIISKNLKKEPFLSFQPAIILAKWLNYLYIFSTTTITGRMGGI